MHVYGQPRHGLGETCAKLGLAIHAFDWTSEMQRVGLVRDALYLIRPDGYVALADRSGDPERVAHYFASRGFSARRRPDEAARG